MQLKSIKIKILLTFLFLLILSLLIKFLFFKQPKIIILSVQPSPQSQIQNLSNPIIINLKNKITQDQLESIKIKIKPQINFNKKWVDNKSVLVFPTPLLKENTEYQVFIYFKNNLFYNWVFKTLASKNKKPNYIDPAGEEIERTYLQKPWLSSLTIREKNYSIDYLKSKQKIRILIKINPNSPLSREEQIKKVKTIAPQKLKEIGVDLNKQKIYYTFIP